MTRDITKIKHKIIKDPHLNVVLYQPEIPSNTGNIARLCGAAEIRLHLIHPLGFRVDDRHLKRAGLDYWYEVDIRYYLSFEALLADMDGKGRILTFSRHADLPYTHLEPRRGDYLMFGRETQGLPAEIRESYSCYCVPIWGRDRSLNLSTTVGIVTYHYLHQMGRF